MRKIFTVLAAAITVWTGFAADAAKDARLLPADAEAAWKEMEKAFRPPTPPAEWGGKPPTDEQKRAFNKFLGEQSDVVANKAKEFYTRFPEHAKAEEAKQKEEQFRQLSKQFTDAAAPEEKLSPEEEKFRKQMNEVARKAMSQQDPGKPNNGIADVIKELEAGLREVMKEFPERPEPWAEMLQAAQFAPAKEEQLRLLKDIVNAKAADEPTVARAKAAIRAVGALGHPFEMSFTAADGRKVEVEKMKGKVVLIDFWAAWCGPCIQSLPEVVALYDEYKEKGFEIVGINMDREQKAMEQVVNRFKMSWPQYFDGKGWGAKYALEYNVTAIPAMWLVDKKGILRTMQAHGDLERQVKELLAE
jgi:thiol-disulfide isomerase/thioredoxin